MSENLYAEEAILADPTNNNGVTGIVELLEEYDRRFVVVSGIEKAVCEKINAELARSKNSASAKEKRAAVLSSLVDGKNVADHSQRLFGNLEKEIDKLQDLPALQTLESLLSLIPFLEDWRDSLFTILHTDEEADDDSPDVSELVARVELCREAMKKLRAGINGLFIPFSGLAKDRVSTFYKKDKSATGSSYSKKSSQGKIPGKKENGGNKKASKDSNVTASFTFKTKDYSFNLKNATPGFGWHEFVRYFGKITRHFLTVSELEEMVDGDFEFGPWTVEYRGITIKCERIAVN